MTYRCFFAALVSGILLLSLAACDDSSTVGLGVGPDTLSGGQPEVVNVFPDPFAVRQSSDELPITSNTSATPSNGHRILAGTVTDPLVGTITTRGHIDFQRAPGVDTVQTIVSVDLVLEPEYQYGSTTDQQTVTVHDAVDEIEDSLRANSTALSIGPEITSGTFTSEDTVVTISMPESWVTANRENLLNASDDEDDGFDAQFQGLVIAPSSGNHVRGFDRRSSRLRVVADFDAGSRDTLEYFGSKSFTYIERSGTPNPPADTELFVSGFNEALAATIDFDGPPFDELGVVPVNRAEFLIAIDNSALERTSPADFVRPTLAESQLSFLLRGQLTDERASDDNLLRDDQYRLCATLSNRAGIRIPTFETSCVLSLEETNDGLLAGVTEFRGVVRVALEEEEPLFSEFTLEASSSEPSITPILFRRPDASVPNSSSRLQLTLIPQR
jgi:hypothetical protein